MAYFLVVFPLGRPLFENRDSSREHTRSRPTLELASAANDARLDHRRFLLRGGLIGLGLGGGLGFKRRDVHPGEQPPPVARDPLPGRGSWRFVWAPSPTRPPGLPRSGRCWRRSPQERGAFLLLVNLPAQKGSAPTKSTHRIRLISFPAIFRYSRILNRTSQSRLTRTRAYRRGFPPRLPTVLAASRTCEAGPPGSHSHDPPHLPTQTTAADSEGTDCSTSPRGWRPISPEAGTSPPALHP